MTRPAPMPTQRNNVVPIRSGVEAMPSPLDRLTARLVLERHRAGTLDAEIVAALLVGVGLPQ